MRGLLIHSFGSRVDFDSGICISEGNQMMNESPVCNKEKTLVYKARFVPRVDDRGRVLIKSTIELNAIGTGVAALLDHFFDRIERDIRKNVVGKRQIQQVGKRANKAISSSHRIADSDRRAGNGESLDVIKPSSNAPPVRDQSEHPSFRRS